MLNFISGRAKTGKTQRIMELIKNDALNGENPILIVPEQFTYESEKAILHLFGENKATLGYVTSFSGLYNTIGRICGGICGKTLEPSDKLILMTRALSECESELKLWKKYANSPSFAESMLKTIDDLKNEAISSNDLRAVLESVNNTKLADKIYDTALIFDSYDMLMGTNFIDPSSMLDRLYDKLKNCDYFVNKKVYFDGFTGFSGQQFKVIEQIIAKAKEVTFSFVDSKSIKGNYNFLSNIKKTKLKLKNIAENHNVNFGSDTYLDNRYYESNDIKLLERFMFGENTQSAEFAENITVCEAKTIYDEAEFVARSIRRILREENAKCSDFVIIARNTETYEDALYTSCENNFVKCYFDKKYSLYQTPVVLATVYAMDYCISPKTDYIFKFLKSGIGILTFNEISELENYCNLWNINGKKWADEWDMNPLGFTDKRLNNENEILNRLNSLRKKVYGILDDFKKSFNKTPENRAKAIIFLLKKCGADKSFLSLKEEYQNNGNEEFADVIRQSYDEFIKILDSIVRCFPDNDIKLKKFYEAFVIAAKMTYISVAPQTIDEAVFGSADRIRPSSPKYAFIMGVNQGVFPKATKDSTLFTDNEISVLKDAGLNITDKVIKNAIDEDFLVYSNVCCASKKVFLSYTLANADLSDATPSSFLLDMLDSISVNKVYEPSILSFDNAPETEKSSFIEFAKRSFYDKSGYKALSEALKGTEYEDKLCLLTENADASNAKISPVNAEKLYGKAIRLSPSGFDVYGRCKFSFFLRYGLNVKKLQPADFNVMQRGTFIHFVLQRIIETYGKELGNLDNNTIKNEIDRFSNEYLDSIKGYRQIEDVRLKFFVNTLKSKLYSVVLRIAKEFAQSDFVPQRCELVIGEKGEIPEININLDNDKSLKLNGIIDRLDTYNGYVRIVDYKTGSRVFKLPDILFGQNLQMLLYLYTVINSGKFGDKPAGVLYCCADKIKKGESKKHTNGLLLANTDVHNAMDKENKGEFVPKYKDEKPSDSFLSEDEFNNVFNFIDKKLKNVGNGIYNGLINATPIDGLDSPACKYCDFNSICRIEKSAVKKVPKMKNIDVLNEIREGGNNAV